MALYSNYAAWIAGVKDWLDADHLTDAQIGAFLGLAQARLDRELNRHLRTWSQENGIRKPPSKLDQAVADNPPPIRDLRACTSAREYVLWRTNRVPPIAHFLERGEHAVEVPSRVSRE